MDPRRNPKLLSDFLLGDVDSGVGLIYRVQRTARSLCHDPGPTGPNGWIIGGGRSAEGDSHDEEDVLELAFDLQRWAGGQGYFAPSDLKDLAAYLTSNATEDIEYLDGVIERVRAKVRRMLQVESVPEETIGDLLGLSVYLRAWLGTKCEHSFRPVGKVAPDIDEVRCDLCNYTMVRAGDQFPLARCEECGVAMERKTEGRTRQFCSDACRKRNRRSA